MERREMRQKEHVLEAIAVVLCFLMMLGFFLKVVIF